MNLSHRAISACGVCESQKLSLLWDLPKFPLTEKYGPFSPSEQLHWHQKLMICDQCGHVQLGVQLSPRLLYTPGAYSFRTSQSKTAIRGSQLFFDFYQRLSQGRTFQSLVDVGGNDLFLAKMTPIQNRCVIDPICSREDGQIVDGVKLIGKFFEEVDFQKEGLAPDLVFCRHVLEHIAQPRQLLQKLFQVCHPEALYFFEIPCFENLLEANRFDAIFHQHYHYFDLDAFQMLIAEMGGEYIGHLYYRQGSCGGALLVAFQRQKNLVPRLQRDIPSKKRAIQKAIQQYQQQMHLLADQLKKFNQQIYGYGASLMLATLGYHLKTDFSELICVLDDDAQKDQLGYQNLPVHVRYSGHCQPEPNSNFIITSLENTRSIYKRIIDLSPRRILIPMVS
jgi:hypothetical protein